MNYSKSEIDLTGGCAEFAYWTKGTNRKVSAY